MECSDWSSLNGKPRPSSFPRCHKAEEITTIRSSNTRISRIHYFMFIYPLSAGLSCIDPHNGQLQVGVIAQLVEHCIGIAEVKVHLH